MDQANPDGVRLLARHRNTGRANVHRLTAEARGPNVFVLPQNDAAGGYVERDGDAGFRVLGLNAAVDPAEAVCRHLGQLNDHGLFIEKARELVRHQAALSGWELRADGGSDFQMHGLARKPTSFSALLIGSYAAAVKRPRSLQFETACIVLPVRRATAAVPPRASITSDVLASGSIPLEYTQFGYAARCR
ncbi:hypothetical protein MMSR116_29305 [Methylobacterium mesophilicum SR1.6/6]|uniref:Uncharacterized protein n=1 Tax=Methylobacterium mesophilicum SR1.6/6 TaxID=908290 RepID=A0A6B9FZ41_9HYPH|nr:hypothetical protein [Methylobacterium mesophilicum]QGY05534.1 hypothetical protein MMSR116_29305 [Methylobacterium mesophilicum SR1.6/6]